MTRHFILVFLVFMSCNSRQSDKTARIQRLPTSTQTNFSVGVTIPQNSGLASVNYKTYRVENDTLYVTDNGSAIDTAHKEIIIEKYPVDKEKIKKLKYAVSKTDTLGDQTNLCIPIQFGMTRFFISFNDNGRKKDGFVANVYRQNIFDIVDILNDIYPDGEIISYDKKELIQQEIDCNKKIN